RGARQLPCTLVGAAGGLPDLQKPWHCCVAQDIYIAVVHKSACGASVKVLIVLVSLGAGATVCSPAIQVAYSERRWVVRPHHSPNFWRAVFCGVSIPVQRS